jgi:hypothetical protein
MTYKEIAAYVAVFAVYAFVMTVSIYSFAHT